MKRPFRLCQNENEEIIEKDLRSCFIYDSLRHRFFCHSGSKSGAKDEKDNAFCQKEKIACRQ